MNTLAETALRVASACGLFAIARRLTARRLRILCYHGIALGDEAAFQPMLFMEASTFDARLDHLARAGYTLLPLGEALERLRGGMLPPAAVTITIDDGWYGTFRHMAPGLARHGFPAMLYLSTYYVGKQTQVFNVAVAYALWKAGSADLELREVDPALEGRFALASPADRVETARRLVEHADGLESADVRQALLERLYAVLRLDFEVVRERRMFAFMSSDEAARLPAQGVELQLHTHRHRFPASNPAALTEEIAANRLALSQYASGPFRHLCYPSGEYDQRAFAQLESLGIESATTTLPGTNTASTPALELRRFLDSEAHSQIRFEAEVSGFLDLIRRVTGRDRPAA